MVWDWSQGQNAPGSLGRAGSHPGLPKERVDVTLSPLSVARGRSQGWCQATGTAGEGQEGTCGASRDGVLATVSVRRDDGADSVGCRGETFEGPWDYVTW